MRLEFGPRGWDLSLEVGILASRLESEPRGGRGGFEPYGKEGHRIGHGQWAPKDPMIFAWVMRLGFVPGRWGLSFEEKIWALRLVLGLGFEFWGWDVGAKGQFKAGPEGPMTYA